MEGSAKLFATTVVAAIFTSVPLSPDSPNKPQQDETASFGQVFVMAAEYDRHKKPDRFPEHDFELTAISSATTSGPALAVTDAVTNVEYVGYLDKRYYGLGDPISSVSSGSTVRSA